MLNEPAIAKSTGPRRWFAPVKRGFDILAAVAALPFVALFAVVLLALNPLANRGPLFFTQARMGRGCKPFTIVKFRTMAAGDAAERGPDDPVEDTRITPLGRVLRRARIDELPQFINVLLGDMSVVGPRPDVWDHAIHYLDSVPGYRERYSLRPGITGLAQVDAGYAEGILATVEKTRADLDYIHGLGPSMELYVLVRTIQVVITGKGR